MKVTFLSTFEKDGGAGAASFRIFESLKSNSKIDLHYVSQFKSPFKKYHPSNLSALYRIGREKFFLKKLLVKKEDLFAFESADRGINLLGHPHIKDADIIHLHWINQGFLSLKMLKQISRQKKIVWTFHDLWPVTGGCSYPKNCTRFYSNCGNCPMLKTDNEVDLSREIWKQKNNIFKSNNAVFVGPSNWILEKIKHSQIGSRMEPRNIPNPIDVNIFKPGEKLALREKMGIDPHRSVMLFGAYNLDDSRKGLNLLQGSINHLRQLKPKILNDSVLFIFGKSGNMRLADDFNMETRFLGTISNRDKLIELYQTADFYIHGATDDNLPNMLIEALACGTPCVAFRTGGIPEILSDRENGILVDNIDTESLAKGILNLLETKQLWPEYAENGRKKIVSSYAPSVIAEKYISVYNELMLQ